MRVGIVSPYSFDAPGGVQFHIRDFAAELDRRGHYVNVLAPAEDTAELPPFLTSAGKAVAVRYNGSVARLSFGPRAAARTRRWLAENQFDLIHVHEPLSPSLSMLALWEAEVPVVATFHSSQVRSRALQLAFPMLRPATERINARIAVSEDARRTVIDHIGGDAVVVPNGVEVGSYLAAEPKPEWLGATRGNATRNQSSPTSPTIAFLGRLDEPRKGLPVLAGAIPDVLARFPGARFLVAGAGDVGRERMEAALGPLRNSVDFLGPVSEEDKARLLKSADLYVAPQTGGESFGIVLVEAMSGGAGVIASDLGSFRRVLADGKAGWLFPPGNTEALSATIVAALENPAETAARRDFANTWVQQYDWQTVASQVEAIYETVLATAAAIPSGDLASRMKESMRGKTWSTR
ncbi:MAG: glycosyltransferase family 4 protein [Promicromonosporaceae bacterium]|nr:glycosyltransferase family 4 protein [Promicromonosporaceae bacterium]